MTRQSSPSLGETIRGARLGYGWCEALGAFVRLTPDGPAHTAVDIRPPGDVPRRSESDREHFVWWASEDAHRIGLTIRHIIAGDGLRHVRVRRRISLVVPDGVELVP